LNSGTTIDIPGRARVGVARALGLIDLAAILANLSLSFAWPFISHKGGPVASTSKCYERTMIPVPLRNILDRLSVAWHERAIALKAISFAFVGVINTVIDFGIFWTAATYLLWPLIPANVLAWLVAVSFSYAMNSLITFGPESGRILRWRDYATFIASGVAGMVCGTSTLFALSYVFPVLAAKLISILVSFVVNFSLSHFVVFRVKPQGDA
jgi:putative flippase GtrA